MTTLSHRLLKISLLRPSPSLGLGLSLFTRSEQCGTSVMTTVSVNEFNMAQEGLQDAAWPDLRVNFFERLGAAGQIPSLNFVDRKERTLNEDSLLIARSIDRSLRPALVKGLRNGIVINVHPISVAPNCQSHFKLSSLAINSSSAALQFVSSLINAKSKSEQEECFLSHPLGAASFTDIDHDMICAGLGSGRFTMLEGHCDEMGNEDLIGKVKEADDLIAQRIREQRSFVEQCKNNNFDTPFNANSNAMRMSIHHTPQSLKNDAMEKFYSFALNAAKPGEGDGIISRKRRAEKQTIFFGRCAAEFMHNVTDSGAIKDRKDAIDLCFKEALRNGVLGHKDHAFRADGRNIDQVRDILAEAQVLSSSSPGSALFSRGESQVLAAVTVGSSKHAQFAGTEVFKNKTSSWFKPENRKCFFVQYDFPGFATNKTSDNAVGRRTVGHARLAENALRRLVEVKEGLTVRVENMVLASAGSTSMAAATASSIALHEAGFLKLENLCAGLSIGLFVDGRDADVFETVVDILGMEDHFGEMDFKIAGTMSGVTSFQLDIKRPFITIDVIKSALHKAQKGRTEILDKVKQQIGNVRSKDIAVTKYEDISIFVPDPSMLFKNGARRLKALEKQCLVDIQVERGRVMVFGTEKRRKLCKSVLSG